jgi:hypothetical protein
MPQLKDVLAPEAARQELSMYRVARLAGLRDATVHDLFNGKTTGPGLPVLLRVLGALGRNLAWLHKQGITPRKVKELTGDHPRVRRQTVREVAPVSDPGERREECAGVDVRPGPIPGEPDVIGGGEIGHITPLEVSDPDAGEASQTPAEPPGRSDSPADPGPSGPLPIPPEVVSALCTDTPAPA